MKVFSKLAPEANCTGLQSNEHWLQRKSNNEFYDRLFWQENSYPLDGRKISALHPENKACPAEKRTRYDTALKGSVLRS